MKARKRFRGVVFALVIPAQAGIQTRPAGRAFDNADFVRHAQFIGRLAAKHNNNKPLTVIPAPIVIPAQAGIQTHPQGRAFGNADFGRHAQFIGRLAAKHNNKPLPVIPAQAGIQNNNTKET